MRLDLVHTIAVVVSVFVGPLAVEGFYTNDSDVTLVTAANLKQEVLESDDFWVIEFFAAWCGHCKSLAPEYEKAASALKGIVRLGAVEDARLMDLFEVKGFPTLKFFGDKKEKQVVFSGQRTAKGIVDFAMAEAKKSVIERLSGESQKSSGSGDGEGQTKDESRGSGYAADPSEVFILTDSNFDKVVMEDEKTVWLVELYAPWCGHCKSLEPAWEEAARELKGRVKVGKVDCTAETVIAKRFQIEGFPTIKLFPAGAKSDSLAVDYQEGRAASSIINFANRYHQLAVEAEELLEDSQIEEKCANKVCVITFLPHILETGAEQRMKYLSDYNTAIRASAGLPVHYFWAQGGDQFEFEEQLRLAFGYPAIVAIHKQKGKFGTHRGSFNQEQIRQFLNGLMARKVPLESLPANLVRIVKSEPWDGTNGEQPEEDAEL